MLVLLKAASPKKGLVRHRCCTLSASGSELPGLAFQSLSNFECLEISVNFVVFRVFGPGPKIVWVAIQNPALILSIFVLHIYTPI